MTKIYSSLRRNVFYLFFTVFFVTCLSAKNYSIKGVVIDSEGNKIAKTTVLLLGEDGTEVQRTETSKKRLGAGGGKFKFKKVLPGGYSLDVDAGELGKANVPVVVADDDISDVEIILPKAKTKTTPKAEPPVESAVSLSSQPTPGEGYILNELSFEIKKMTAEIKHLNTELNDLKSLSKMWINPLAIYSKEIILKNGSTVFGKIIYQDEKTLKVETLIGYLIINRGDVVRVVDNVVMEEQQEYVPEQIRDSYTPPPMPKLAEPRYVSSSPEAREAGKKYSANCVLMGNISEKKDTQGNVIFAGQIKNIGGRRADFVKVDFVFRRNWSGETKTLTTFLVGVYHTFESGITTDATLLPGAVGTFELYVPHSFGSFIGYSYVIDWMEYE
ncbi:MAG TPA: carboxypeptidase-like regulatory domain-containing protein [Candidatus Marinimicrobia bacterium]|nr:carboxypeptidase-like regulatory domain-containing protein [Candidatus Neomarinimicrobiota bacterium]HJL78031.1 carboxypeptidase-like regulatory domain-containing protein [Candidatus Neomarinimicrobiota bacterium]